MTSNTIDPNPDSRSAGRRKDPAWKYHSLVNPNDLNTFKCNFCGKLTKGGVYRAKQHLAGGYRNAEICSKCPPHVRDEIIEFMSKKKGKNDFDDMPDFDDIDTLGDDVDDEMDVGAFQNRGKRPMQGQASSMQQKKQRQQQRGPLDLFLSAKPKVSNQKDAKGKQTTIESHVNKELRENACVWFSRWMYEAGIPFNAVNYPSFKPMMEAVGRAGPGMKPPSFHEVRVPYLKKEVEHTKEIMKSHREEWARYGCTIMCDGWKDKRDRSLLNFLVNSPKGSVFIESIDTSSYAKDGMKLYQLLDRFVEEIGEANVVQVVTDNASANVLAGEFLMTKHKNLYWTPCAAHCLDLMLEDIFKIPRLKSTFQKACSVNGYLYSSAQVLNMMRSFTQKREMLRPGKTRFATAFLTLSRFHKQKANLRKMFTSEEWTNSRFAKETRGKQAAQTVLQESFWKNILFALKVSGPLVKVLRVVDNEDKPAMPYIYEAMDRAKEAIAKSFDDESKYEKIFEIIDERWNVQLHRPLHAAGYYLNPAFFYSNESIREDNEVIEGLYACIERLVPTAEVQDKLSKELSFYKNSEGLFGKQICIRGRNQLSPVEWWSQFGTGTPNLQKFAMKICSLTCSSSGCERNWSIFEHVLTMEKFEHLEFLLYYGEKASERIPLRQAALFFANSDPDMPAAPVAASQVHDWLLQNITSALEHISERVSAKENGSPIASDQDVPMSDACASSIKTSTSTRGPSFIEGISKSSYLKHASDLKGSSVKVINCHDSVIYILAPLRYATIYGCSDTTIVVGAVGKAVRVEHCERVHVIAAAKRICIANCRECVFFLGVNQRPLIVGDNHKLQVAPYNTFYSQLEEHMNQVGIEATINRWDEPVALGVVDPHDSLSHPAGVSDVQAESATCVDPDQFTNFLIPNWFESENSGSTKNNPFPLPDVYISSQQKNHNNLGEIKQMLRETQLEENRKRELSSALHVYFKDWLYASGNIRQLYCIQGD